MYGIVVYVVKTNKKKFQKKVWGKNQRKIHTNLRESYGTKQTPQQTNLTGAGEEGRGHKSNIQLGSRPGLGSSQDSTLLGPFPPHQEKGVDQVPYGLPAAEVGEENLQ